MLRRAFTLVELLVAIAVIGVMAGLLLPAIQSARNSASRTQCTNNLRQIGIAIQNFVGTHRVFPASGWTQKGPGNPAGKYVGWRPLTLSYIEQDNVRQLYRLDLNWWEGTNATLASVPIKVFQCPSVPERREVLSAVAKNPRPALTFDNPQAPTDYEAIMGVQPASINPQLDFALYNASNRFSVMYRNSTTRIGSVTDGTTKTIMIVECAARPLVFRQGSANWEIDNDQGICWADSEGPFSLDGATADGTAEGCGSAGGCVRGMNARNDNEMYSFHPEGVNVVFADSHVEFLHESIELKVVAALCTMRAEEVISSIDN